MEVIFLLNTVTKQLTLLKPEEQSASCEANMSSVKKFPAFYETAWVIAMLKISCYPHLQPCHLCL
jgi:hypothetical protein